MPANLYDAIDGNCCTKCGGKGFRWLKPANDAKPGASRPIEICTECGGYGFMRNKLSVSSFLAITATLLAVIVFVIIPLARIIFGF